MAEIWWCGKWNKTFLIPWSARKYKWQTRQSLKSMIEIFRDKKKTAIVRIRVEEVKKEVHP